MTGNGAIHARLKDATGQTGRYATGNVTNIDKTGPTVTIEAQNITSNSVTLKVTASDNQSGLATTETYSYYYNGTFAIKTTDSSYNYTGLNSETSYVLKVMVVDKLGNSTEATKTITTEKQISQDLNTTIGGQQYGDYIDYNIDLNDDGDTTNDWRIFYNDGTNIFIIAADYLPNKKAPVDKTDMVISTSNRYGAAWPVKSKLTRAGASEINKSVASKFMLS